MAKFYVIFIISGSISYVQVQNIVAVMSQRGMQRSNCYKVHPDTDYGPCSHCGQEDISKRYVHLVQKNLDSIECYDFVEKTYNISDFSCIGRKCERKFYIFFSRVTEENDINGASSSKKICQNVSCSPQKMCFLHHFDICDENEDHTTDIDLLLLGKKFDISISDKFADKKEQVFSDVLCHAHYNVLNTLKREKECFV